MKQAVQFGAGNIGRGFLGQLYFESRYETTFVDVMDDLVNALNERGEYPLRIVDETPQTLCIGNVRAVNGKDASAVADVLAKADIAATAVGVPVMGKIAPLIAAGIAKRFADPNAAPLNIIICENMLNAGPFLREKVREFLPAEFHAALDARVGFVEASIGRMVPVMTDAVKAEDPLLVEVEAYCELPVDAAGFKGPIPPLKNMVAKPNFGAYVERKLFVHNLSHAATAYLGYPLGHEYIWQAVEDSRVRSVVEAAMAETCEGLHRKHGIDRDELSAHAADLLRRYHNKALGDQVARVAKDPIRKLGPHDRLIGSGRMCLEQGVSPENVVRATVAALQYDHPDDPAALVIQTTIREKGLNAVLTDICGLQTDELLAVMIREQWAER